MDLRNLIIRILLKKKCSETRRGYRDEDILRKELEAQTDEILEASFVMLIFDMYKDINRLTDESHNHGDSY